MLDRVEVAVVEQPLPRLQIVGSGEQTLPFLYDIGWGTRASFSPAPTAPRRSRWASGTVAPWRRRPTRAASPTDPAAGRAALDQDGRDDQQSRYRRAGPSPPPFRARSADSAQGAARGSGRPASRALFYCRKPFRRAPDADHFIPRVRCGIDAVENLVLADSACNNDKRDLLPASALVDAWADRNLEHEDTLAQLASSCGWDSDAPGTLAVVRSIYRHLPPCQLAFWLGTGRVDITHVRPGIVIDIALAAAADMTR